MPKHETSIPATNPDHFSPCADRRPYMYTSLTRKPTAKRIKAKSSQTATEQNEPNSQAQLIEKSTSLSHISTPKHDNNSCLPINNKESSPSTPQNPASTPILKFDSLDKANEMIEIQDKLLRNKEKQEKLLEAKIKECDARITLLGKQKELAETKSALWKDEAQKTSTTFKEYIEGNKTAHDKSVELVAKLQWRLDMVELALRKAAELDGFWMEVGRLFVGLAKAVVMIGLGLGWLMVLVVRLAKVVRVLWLWLIR